MELTLKSGGQCTVGRIIQLQMLKNKAVIADKCVVAERFFDRLKGLIGTRAFEPGMGMLFPKCNSVHMWWMRIPIDIVFLREKSFANGSPTYVVSSVHANIRPWKFFPVMDFQSQHALELPVGSIERLAVRPGDELCLS